LLAVATSGGWVRVFDVATGSPASEPLAGYLAGANKINFSADGKSLVTCGEDGAARLWNIATGREMLSGLPGSSFWEFEWVFLARDGNSVVEAAGRPNAIRVVRLPTLAKIDASREPE
jgi:WD40 repeat protein